MSNRPPARQPAAAKQPGPRGPVTLILATVLGLFFATLVSWMFGVLIELSGIYYFWPEEGIDHSRRLVQEDMGYISAAPRSVLVDDTVGFATEVVDTVEQQYRRIGIPQWYERTQSREAETLAAEISFHVSRVLLMTMYVAQDTLLRLAVAGFAIPAFFLACLLGLVDGLVRRDLRRWGGGRESSFVYHHAKRYTKWALTGGFTAYLAWPFGGFDPALMVLTCTALVAAALSTTVASFKKYI